MKSKQLFDLVEKSIDVRIALEALFCKGEANTELSLRLALRGAWYLGNDASERVQYFETLKKAYGICSKAVHTGFLKDETSTRVLLSNAQDICRKALLKCLDEGGDLTGLGWSWVRDVKEPRAPSWSGTRRLWRGEKRTGDKGT